MTYTYTENFDEHNGIISNLHGFFHRHLDTGFKSKWSGYWVPPMKILDYYAYKINDSWISPSTLIKASYDEEMRFVHDLPELSVVETIKTPEDVPGFVSTIKITNKSNQDTRVSLELEIALDIRHKSNDIGDGAYSLTERKGQLIASRNGQKVMVETEPAFHDRNDPEKKFHSPGQKQEAFIPGLLTIDDTVSAGETKKVTMTVTTSGPRFGSVDAHDQSLEGTEFDGLLEESIDSLLNLVYDRNGRGIIAGHPWFQEYWARDSFWSVMGIIDAGAFDLATAILETFVDNALESKVTLDSSSSTDNLGRADTLPLFILAVDKLERHHTVPERLKDAQRDAMAGLSLDGDTVSHQASGTWMDTLDRHDAVEIQSLWLQAAKVMRDSRVNNLRSGLEQFMEDKKIKDTLDDSLGITANASIPLFFGQVDRSRALEYLTVLNKELVSEYGARTLGRTAEQYSPDGYHTGSVWGLTTGWLAGANLRYGNVETGIQLLKSFGRLRERDQPGALPEVVDAEKGESIGCSEQAWSAGLMVNVIDAYLFGITTDGNNRNIDPIKGFSGVRHGKRIDKEFITIEADDRETNIR